MALTITPYSIMLDSANPNMKFPQELMQGSTDAEFIITVLKDGVEQTIDSGAKVTMIINYHVEGSGCNLTHSASYVLDPSGNGYNISIDTGKIKIPFRTEITNAYGTSQMILKIEDGTVAYTYSMLFDVVKNDAYTTQSVPDNLPKFDDLQEDVKQLQTDTSANTQKITTNANDLNQAKVDIVYNKQNLNDKADKDLSNIPAVTESPEGSILYVKDGTLKHFGMTVDDDKKQINSPYSIEVPPNTLHIGKNVSISENGGFVQNHTESLGKDYLFLDYENDPNTGTKKPIYYKRGAKVIQHPLQNIATTPMTLTTYNIGQTQFDHQTQAFYLNLVDAVTNLCLKVTVNGKDIAFYPDELAWNATTPEEKVASPGYNKIAGLRKMPIKPFWSSLTEYQIVLTFKADAPIRVMGDGVKPYFAIDENPITRLEMATMEDVAAGSGKDTAEDIRDKLAGLAGDERLGIESLKDVEDTISGDYCKTKLEELTGDGRLDASAVKNLPQPSIGSTTFSGLTDTPADYIGAANKFLAVNAAHTGIEFVDGVAQDKTFVELTDTPTDYTGMSGKIVAVKSSEDGVEFIDSTSGSEVETLHFRHAFGIKAMNKTGQTIPANSFVFLSPKANGRYNMAPVTRTTGYKGEMFGLLEKETATDVEEVVNLIDNIQTGVTGVAEGVPAYIGFESFGFDTISINKKDQLETEFGRCGVFGGTNDLGEFMASFDGFQVQANYLIDEHHDEDIDYHSSMPATINKKALFVYLFADMTGSGGTIIQQLPLLSEVEDGMQLTIENQSTDPTDKVTLQASGNDLIDSSPTFGVKGANHRIILIATHNRWVKLYDSEVNGGGADASQVAQNTAGIQALDTRVQANEAEITRLKTDISTGGLSTYVFRDRGIPAVIPTDKAYKAYYIHSLVLQDSNQVLNIPSNVPDGAIFSVENNDRTDYLSLRPPTGETINGNSGVYQCGHDTLNYFVKDGTDFKLAYGGVFPNNYDAMKSTIQTLFPNSLHTLAEVEAQLKDRLHTFREIQNEFNDQLHTFSDIEADMTAKGFRKQGGRMGVQGDQTVPTDISSWSVKDFATNEEFLLPAQNKGSQYVLFSLPTDSASIVGEILINQQTMGFTSHDLIDNELDYKVFISKDPVDTSTSIRFKINYIHGTDVMIEWGLSDTQSVNVGSSDWIYGQMQANQHVIPPIQSQNKYMVFKVPVELFPVIDGVYVGAKLEETTNTAVIAEGTYNYRLMATNDKVDLSMLTKVNINYDYSGSGSGSGIEIDDGTTDKTGIKKINVKGMYLDKVFDDSSEVDLKAVTSWETMDGMGGGRVNRVLTEAPLLSYLDPNTNPGEEPRVKLYVQHDYFELAKPPGYLAYLVENEEVMGRVKPGETGVRTAPIWFDDNVVGGNSPFIEIDKPNKALGIQDYTDDDPNVTGGIPTLIAFRVAMKGKAPNDGFVELLLKKTDEGTPTQDGDYLLNANGNPIGIRKQYKSGDDLGTLDCMSIYMAKGLTKFQCIVEHDFVNDGVLLEDRTEGASGILIQALGTDYATGDALLQFENDTMQNIEMSKHYNGEDIFNMAWALTYDRVDVDITTGTGQTSVDGLHFYNNTNLKVGVADNTIHIHDNGTDMAYFNLGQIFSAEKTYMLRNKDLDIKVTLQDKENAFRIYMVKWTGNPDVYTNKVIASYDPDTGAVADVNWTLDGSIFISEDAISGEHDFAGTLTVPADANNFAVVIAPGGEQTPIDLYMKGFEVDVSDPFYGWILEAPELVGEKHLQFDERHAELRCDVAGYASIRYTLNNVPAGMPMPIGVIKSGKADIEIDHTINQVAGTALPQFEGAIKFNKEGKALIQTDLYVHSEKTHDILATTKFWYSKVSTDGNTFTKIPLSEYTTQVRGQTKAINKMPKFEVDVQPGDRIALFGTTDQADGAFIDQHIGDPTPMLKTVIDFDEITEAESDLLDKITTLDEEIVITERAANAGWYIELDYDPDTGKPSLSPKQRNP